MGFAAAIVVGFVAHNAASTILWRALLVMVVGWVVGRIIGGIAQRTVDDHLKAYKQQHPIPGDAPESEQQGTDMAGEPA